MASTERLENALLVRLVLVAVGEDLLDELGGIIQCRGNLTELGPDSIEEKNPL